MDFVMIVTLVLVVSTIGVGISCVKKAINGQKVKTFLGVNLATFFVVMIAAAVFCFGGGAASAEVGEVTASAAGVSADGFAYLAAALSTGLATIGAGIAVAVSASAALGAISENQKLLGKTLIFVGLAEGIAIYGLIVSILILGKIG